MLYFHNGNLLNTNCKYICHQVNCQGKMNSGVAKQIREKYPEVFEVYAKKYKEFPLGSVLFVETEDGKCIGNMFGQDNYGYDGKQYTSYEAIEQCLTNVYYHCKTYHKTAAFPYGLASVRGGASWDKIYEMIEYIFTKMDMEVDVEIWRFDKG